MLGSENWRKHPEVQIARSTTKATTCLFQQRNLKNANKTDISLLDHQNNSDTLEHMPVNDHQRENVQNIASVCRCHYMP